MRSDLNTQRLLARSCTFVLVAGCLTMPLSCSKQENDNSAKPSGSLPSAEVPKTGASSALGTASITNAGLPAWKRELLDLAWMAASKVPEKPHVKTKAKLQEQVCGANIELNQVASAAALIEQIPNYRKGIAYADLAYHCLKQDRNAAVAEYLAQAKAVAEELQNEQTEQLWRRDRIRAHMARAYVAMGETKEADSLAKTIEESEAGEFIVAKTERLSRKDFEVRFEVIQAALQGQSFEQKKNAVGASVRLHDMFFDDSELRSLIETEIVGNTQKMPLVLQADLRLRLAENQIKHGDSSSALKLVKQAQGMVAGSGMIARDRIPHMARISGLRAEAGDLSGARTLHTEALALFNNSREQIFDIYRAGLLRALAEACATMKDHAQAAGLYLKAVNEGTINPNAVPGTEDLVATCLSMVRSDAQPDATLVARMQSICAGLSQPW